ncbi:putative lipid II flippase FtsW [Arthrobacter sp. zg-Y820]|uniref:putative lipid II flippase FtsW n=1 Tax=unclassified Arthrobacter TaxID=235627 RepID=UPI001E4E5F29|nr:MULTISPECIES: putative lipid II flippase FtsW [unclassified Arthrobacter]MCC9197865.1 putative lipid II flippase FtsW [Arthrobacter sp. zg-Y820]MDK1280732.1 putative lipid II flippase FtsW [Arthrobacter sp. zg.Y820]MDK1360926.1 putative lipid II flippase FtsW [Arthrobacter sp. zg-Y1219]WIB10639.1 putative lipid II flippase FtsW [Arthrobacter sp. zg-Y820]
MVTTSSGNPRKPVLRSKRPAAGTSPAASGRGTGTPSSGRPASAGSRPASRAPAAPGKKPSMFERGIVLIDGSRRTATGSAYYTILGASLALTAIGLMMVLSASSVESIAASAGESVGSTFNFFVKQAMFAGLGVAAMLGLSRLGPKTFKKMAWGLMALAAVLLILVLIPGIGKEVNGNRNWIEIGPITGQPSEAAKLAMAIWFASMLSLKQKLITQWKHALVPVVFPGGLLLIGLVMLGSDLGTVIIMGMIMIAALFFAGAPLRFLTALVGLGAGAAVLMSALSGNRSSRISAWLKLDCGGGVCDQANAGMYALASGGWFGVGIGQSRQKWSWIPEAHNDFIFAIIGEEFGLLGTLLIVLLFGVLAVATIRMTMRHTDPFIRILCGSILVWIIGQAFVNIAMVTGLLPVIGVPLPFISYGGSSLTFTLAAIGVLLSFARKVPEHKLPESEPSAP